MPSCPESIFNKKAALWSGDRLGIYLEYGGSRRSVYCCTPFSGRGNRSSEKSMARSRRKAPFVTTLAEGSLLDSARIDEVDIRLLVAGL